MILNFKKFNESTSESSSIVGKKCKFGTKTVSNLKLYSGTIEEEHKDGNVVIIPDKGNGKTIFDSSGNPINRAIRDKRDIEIID